MRFLALALTFFVLISAPAYTIFLVFHKQKIIKQVNKPIFISFNEKKSCINKVRFGKRGQVIFYVFVNGNGDVLNIQLAQPSGNKYFDEIILLELEKKSSIGKELGRKTNGRCYYFYATDSDYL